MTIQFDAMGAMGEISELNAKLLKAAETMAEIEEVDVGTAPKDLVFDVDKVRLYRYRREGSPTCKTPVILVYALVNRYYMLDLQPDRSLVRKLLEQGLDLYVIDWGYPTRADQYLTLDDYIDDYLNDCVDFVRESTGSDKITLMGICQGGTFSTIYTALNPAKVKNLVTLVTPIDFSTDDGLLNIWSRNLNIDALADTYGIVPGDFMNVGFLMLMPFTLNISKYLGMLDLAQDKEKLLNFIRMEKWIFDSPAQAGACLRKFIKDLYQGNKLIKGELEIGGRKVDLKKITVPLLNIYAAADHLVPPNSTKPLNDLVGSKDKDLYEFKGGHIGVFVGSRSQKELAPAIAEWLHKRSSKK
jgi:polyhydroxyalkanoate synthase